MYTGGKGRIQKIQKDAKTGDIPKGSSWAGDGGKKKSCEKPSLTHGGPVKIGGNAGGRAVSSKKNRQSATKGGKEGYTRSPLRAQVIKRGGFIAGWGECGQ